jgi:hypothetical protein
VADVSLAVGEGIRVEIGALSPLLERAPTLPYTGERRGET